jgi:hypothetical protein
MKYGARVFIINHWQDTFIDKFRNIKNKIPQGLLRVLKIMNNIMQ